MRTLLLLVMVTAFGLQQADGALWNFEKMVEKVARRSALYYYSDYGCYCGYNGDNSDGYPVDATDWCCFAHDCCYDELESEGCSTYLLDYNVNYEKNNIVTCVDEDYCKRRLCECDRTAAFCFKHSKNSYSKQNRDLDRSYCTQTKPKCGVHLLLGFTTHRAKRPFWPFII